MSTPVPNKRRRLNDATQQLKRPFVSPLRISHIGTVGQATKAGKQTPVAQSASPTSSHVVHSATGQNTLDQDSPLSTPLAKHLRHKPSSTSNLTLGSNTPTSYRDVEETSVRRAIAALEARLRQMRKDVDILRQARQISGSKQHAELGGLTEKWRSASQAAAEELFGTVKERVCRMGGVAAWRETERRKRDRAFGFGAEDSNAADADDDADCEFDSQGEELSDAEQEYRKKLKRQSRQEAMDAAEPSDRSISDAETHRADVQIDQGEDDDSFTMDMMLRSLNIDLNVIGFDKQAQRWLTLTEQNEPDDRVDSQQEFDASSKADHT